MLVSTSGAGNDIVLTLVNAPGSNLAYSGKTTATGNRNTLISGSAAVTAIAGEEITLRNGSSQSITLERVAGTGANGFVSSMTVVRLT